MVKTRDQFENIRNVIIKEHSNSKGYRAITEDLEISGAIVCNFKFYSHKTVRTLPGRDAKK